MSTKTIQANTLPVNNMNTNIFDFIQLNFKNNNKVSTSLEMVEGIIKAKVGKDINELNEFTIASIAQNFSLFLKKQGKTKKALVVHDNSVDGIMLAKVFASMLIFESVEAFFNYKNKPLNNALAITVAKESEIDFDYIITFTSAMNQVFMIHFFDKDGNLLDSEDSKKINFMISETDFLNIKVPIQDVPSIKWNEAIDKYKADLKIKNNIKNVNMIISNNYSANQEVLEELVFLNDINCDFIKPNQAIKKENKLIKQSILKSSFKNKDLIINFSNNINNIEILVKHRRRWKFLNYNDLAILYINYILDTQQDVKNKEVFFSFISSQYIGFFAKKNDIKATEYEAFSDLDINMKNILLSTNGMDFFITNENKNLCSDPILIAKKVIEIVSYYKNKEYSIFNKAPKFRDLYEVLTSIYLKNGVFHNKTISESLDAEKANLFLNRLQNLTKVNDIDVIRIIKKENAANSIQIILRDKSVINFKYYRNSSTLISNYSIWSEQSKSESNKKEINKKVKQSNRKRQKLKNKENYDLFINLIVKEKRITNEIASLKEVYSAKHFGWKGFVKYSILIAIFILLCYLMFTFVLRGKNDDLWLQVRQFLSEEYIYSYLLPVFVFGVILQTIVNCWFSYRILTRLGEKPKLRHLIISNFISICISTITPMIYGGESVGYWYLRRKGLKRAPLASMFLVQSLITQLNIILFSAVFVPIGFYLFVDTIASGKYGLLMIFLVVLGFMVDIFSAIMIALLTFNKSLTTSISNTLNKFLEWIPFIITRDSLAKGANLKYEFQNINDSAKLLFKKDGVITGALFFIELLFYRFGNRFLNIGAISAIIGHSIDTSKFNYNGYFAIVAAQTLVGSINGINFIIPGGIGLADWAAKHIMEPLYKGDPPYYNISVIQTMGRILFTFTIAILSAFALATILIGESRVDKYKKIQKTLTQKEIKEGKIKIKTTFYFYAGAFWILGLIILVTSWTLIYRFLIKL